MGIDEWSKYEMLKSVFSDCMVGCEFILDQIGKCLGFLGQCLKTRDEHQLSWLGSATDMRWLLLVT